MKWLREGKCEYNSFHLAGIIPIAGRPLDFNMPWHDSMMPIAPNYTLLHHAAQECAMAGCETIWVVCPPNMQPMIREMLGEWIRDRLSNVHTYWIKKEWRKRRIPIFYVPIHPKDHERWDALGMSALHGAWTAYDLSIKISKWTIPDKFYVSFPYGICDIETVESNRKTISHKNSLALTYNGESFRDGRHLSFTFDGLDYNKCMKEVRRESTLGYYAGGSRTKKKDQYSARYFSIDKIFQHVIIENELKVNWFYDIDSWDKYTMFLSKKSVDKPIDLEYNEWNRVGEDEE